jgi:hypothetical protein
VAQIAHARTFDSTDDYLLMADGGLITAITDMTVAAIIRINDEADYRSIMAIPPDSFEFMVNPVNALSLYNGSVTQQTDIDYVTEAMDWLLVAVTKTNGTVTPRWHRYTYGTTTWDHQDDSSSIANAATPQATSEVYIGTYDPTTDLFNGEIAVVGFWNSTVLSDGQLEGLTDDIAAWEALSPASLWLLNQSDVTTTVEDLTGTSDEIGRVGTTATAVSDLPFDVGGVDTGLAWIRA